MDFIFWTCFGVMFLLNIVQTMWNIEHRRYYCRKDLSEIANDRYSCRLIAEALEIEAPGEKVEQYVSWAIKDRLRRDEHHA